MKKKNAKKYFKYAIGEIVLVVTGVQIALQINNWNTERIQPIESREIAKRLLLETIIKRKAVLKQTL